MEFLEFAITEAIAHDLFRQPLSDDFVVLYLLQGGDVHTWLYDYCSSREGHVEPTGDGLEDLSFAQDV